MAEEPVRRPLVRSRGAMLIDDFCRSTGLDRATVENLMRTDLHDVSLWKDEELTIPFGIFDDALPSRQALVALDLPVRDDYDLEALRSHLWDGEEDPDPDEDRGAGPGVDRLSWGP